MINESVESATFKAIDGTNTTWLLLTAFLIFLFQAGSILVTNAKNKNFGNYGLKVLVNLSVSMICWYVTGYAFTYGRSDDDKLRNRYIGNFGFALNKNAQEQYAGPMFGLPFFFHTWTLAITANTIVSNGLGGRGTLLAHILTTAYVMLFLYPVSAHWVLSDNGWLSPIRAGYPTYKPFSTGVVDFGAAGPVHLFGGYVSLACSIFTMRTSDVPRPEEPDTNILSLGTFLNLFAFYGYISSAALNPGVNVAYAFAAGRAAINLTMTIASTMLVTLLMETVLSKSFNLSQASDAVTMGWVVISSNCLTCEPWAALVAGVVAGLLYVGGRRITHSLKDNNNFLIHGLGAIWGLAFTGVLAKPQFIRGLISNTFYPAADHVFYTQKGIFYPSKHLNGKLLGLLILEMLTISGWALFMSAPLFAILHFSGKLVVPEAKAEPVAEQKQAVEGEQA